MNHRVVPARSGDGSRERGGLQKREVRGVSPEVRSGGGLHAVGAVPEVDGVQILGQDLVLGELVLELDGHDRLADLAAQRRLAAGEHGFHVLLGDRGAALVERPVLHVDPRRPGDGDGIDPIMGVETLVLHGHHRLPKSEGHPLEWDDRAVHCGVQLGDGLPAPVHQIGRLAKGRDRRKVDRPVDVGESGCPGSQQQKGDGRDDGHNPAKRPRPCPAIHRWRAPASGPVPAGRLLRASRQRVEASTAGSKGDGQVPGRAERQTAVQRPLSLPVPGGDPGQWPTPSRSRDGAVSPLCAGGR